MNKLLNRRFIYLEHVSLEKIPLTLEEVDNFVKYSKALELSSESTFIYGDFSGNYKVGREVVGHDSDLAHHDNILVVDYPIQSYNMLTFDFSSYEDILSKIQNEKRSNDQYASFRISLLNYESAVVHFFD
jgi:hypothetical protein